MKNRMIALLALLAWATLTLACSSTVNRALNTDGVTVKGSVVEMATAHGGGVDLDVLMQNGVTAKIRCSPDSGAWDVQVMDVVRADCIASSDGTRLACKKVHVERRVVKK